MQFVLPRCGGRHIRDVLNERYNSPIAVFRWGGRPYEPRLLGRSMHQGALSGGPSREGLPKPEGLQLRDDVTDVVTEDAAIVTCQRQVLICRRR